MICTPPMAVPSGCPRSLAPRAGIRSAPVRLRAGVELRAGTSAEGAGTSPTG